MGVHNRVTTLGGYAFMTDPKYCLVEYNEVEQNEPGDTLSHTFNFPGWAVCEWRWWYIVATVDGAPSPSASCIFQAHYLDQEEAESLKHTDLIEKEVAGVIDHADNSITADKLEHDLNGVPIGLNADKVDGLHSSELGGSWPLLYASNGQYYEWNVDSIDGFRQEALVGASITLHYYRVLLDTGGANTAAAYLRKYISPPGRTMTWDKTRSMFCKVNWLNDDWQEGFALMGSTEGDLHVGWKVAAEKLYASSFDGIALRQHHVQDIVPGTTYDLVCIHVPGDRLYWLIDDAPVYDTGLGLPTGVAGAGYIFAFILQAKIAAVKQANLYGFRFVQEP